MSARVRTLVLATLVTGLLPAAVAAQSIVTASATPNPFAPGATMTISTSLTPGASPESWCFTYDFCYIVGAEPLLSVTGSNGFSAQAGRGRPTGTTRVPGRRCSQ